MYIDDTLLLMGSASPTSKPPLSIRSLSSLAVLPVHITCRYCWYCFHSTYYSIPLSNQASYVALCHLRMSVLLLHACECSSVASSYVALAIPCKYLCTYAILFVSYLTQKTDKSLVGLYSTPSWILDSRSFKL